MPPPGIPEWLYPGALLRNRTERTRFLWVYGIHVNMHREFTVQFREATITPDPDEGRGATVTVRRPILSADLGTLLNRCEPVLRQGVMDYVLGPEIGSGPERHLNETLEDWEHAPLPFINLPLQGFTRLGAEPTEMWPPPVEGGDAGLQVVSNHSLLGAIDAGHIRVASRPRISPLGGIAIVIQQDGPSPSGVYIDRSDLGLPILHIGHDATRGVRVLTNTEIMRDAVQNLPTPESVAQAHEALRVFAEQHAAGRVSRRSLLNAPPLLVGALPDPEDPEATEQARGFLGSLGLLPPGTMVQVGSPHPITHVRREDITLDDGLREELRRTAEDPDYTAMLLPASALGIEYQPPLTPGTVLVLRSNPETIVGVVLSVRSIHDAEGTRELAEVQFTSSQPFLQNAIMEVRIPDLLLDAMPAPGNILDSVRSMGNTMVNAANFLSDAHIADSVRRYVEHLKARAVPSAPAPTSFERLLRDDDD